MTCLEAFNFIALELYSIGIWLPLWNPHLKKDIILLENIQRGFTQYIVKVSHLSYSERLTALNLYSLQRRRERYFIIKVWKILEGIVPNLTSPILSPLSQRRGHLSNINHVNQCFNLLVVYVITVLDTNLVDISIVQI